MQDPVSANTIGLLLSGGLDSSILTAHLLRAQRVVQPFYVTTGVTWEACELAAVRRFLDAIGSQRLKPLVTLTMPLGDLYGDHWSTTGERVPSASTDDDAVYLPGRNALLALKPAIWCKLRGISELAMAALGTNPFADASPSFFEHLEAVLNAGAELPVRIMRPFERLSKVEVMRLAAGCPLQLTFSCIAPAKSKHCGVCNKCAERQAAFRHASMDDPTDYER